MAVLVADPARRACPADRLSDVMTLAVAANAVPVLTRSTPPEEVGSKVQAADRLEQILISRRIDA
jgi:hypothetical protein